MVACYLVLGDGEEGIGTVQNVAASQITLDPNLQYQFRTDTGQLSQIMSSLVVSIRHRCTLDFSIQNRYRSVIAE
jgi:hypothetical protein